MTRRRGPIQESGRPIHSSAYAWYNRGLYHERAKNNDAAAVAFSKTLKLDPRSGVAWAALGRVLCAENSDFTMRTFSEGLDSASRSAPILVARGYCRLSKKDNEGALSDGLSAVRTEPSGRKASLLVVSAYQAMGRQVEALRFERAYRLLTDSPPPTLEVFRRREMDRALRRGRLQVARQLALGNTTPGHLAARALAWGQSELARTQARLVFDASPSDGDAAATLLLLGESPEFTGGHLSPPSAVTILLVALRLRRTIDPETARGFLAENTRNEHSLHDPLVVELLDVLDSRD